MPGRIAAISLVLIGASSAMGQTPYKDLKVKSCPAADSLLGSLEDDGKGSVRGFHHQERDTTYLFVGAERRPRFTATMKFAGQRPTRSPAMQLDLWFRGKDAEAIKDIPSVTLVLDDSIDIVLDEVRLGTFVGPDRPSNVTPVQPVSALLQPAVAVRALRARTIAVRVDAFEVRLSPSERRDMRALLRVAVCP
jgi:hypothetical protein